MIWAAVMLVCAAAQAGTASWYGWEHAGKPTANGERFDPTGLTAASWHHPFGARLLVTSGRRSVVVRVNDRGPAKRLRREIDLSLGAFSRIADPRVGLIEVNVRRIK